MKKILALALLFAATTFGTVALADDVTISITKAGDNKAKVSVWPDGKTTSVVPICFGTDAGWDNVKDTYTVSPATASGLEHKKLCVSVDSNGTATFMKSSCGMKSKK